MASVYLCYSNIQKFNILFSKANTPVRTSIEMYNKDFKSILMCVLAT